MLSIGILGCLVWSQFVMALLCCEIKVINFAICWNSLVLLSTLYSKNLSNFTQSAGNLIFNFNKSSSETTREISFFNLDPFHKIYNTNYETNKKISDDWLTWFIGFTEGDGAILTFNDRLKFVLTQKEGAILYHIQEVLGFGKVKKYTNNLKKDSSSSTSPVNNEYYRFIVEDFKHILILANLFNGNLVLPNRSKQLNKWIDVLNNKLDNNNVSNIIFIDQLMLPSLENAWLSGFTDAEGCFNVNIGIRKKTLNGHRIILRFLLDQKDAYNTLLNIRNLFGIGQVSLRSETKSVFRYNNNSFKGLIPVINYFNNYPLKTKKSLSLNNWLIVFNMVQNKEHLSIEGLNKIKVITKTINLNNSLNTKIGSAFPNN